MNTSPDTPDTPDPLDLDHEVRRLLGLHRGQWGVIAIVAEVSHSWLSKFTRGHITNPSYATLKRLHSLLKDSPIPQPQPMAAMLLRRRTEREPLVSSGGSMSAAQASPPEGC